VQGSSTLRAAAPTLHPVPPIGTTSSNRRVHDDQEDLYMDKIQRLLRAIDKRVENAQRKEALTKQNVEDCDLNDGDACARCYGHYKWAIDELYAAESAREWILSVIK